MVAHGSDVTATLSLPFSDSIEFDEQAHYDAAYRAVVGEDFNANVQKYSRMSQNCIYDNWQRLVPFFYLDSQQSRKNNLPNEKGNLFFLSSYQTEHLPANSSNFR